MNLFDLPVEILQQIGQLLDSTFEPYYWEETSLDLVSAKVFQRLSLVNRAACDFALPLRYRKLVFEHGQWLQRFAHYIDQHPSRAPLVREIVFRCHSAYWQPTQAGSRGLTWSLFTNLRTLRVADYLTTTDVQKLSSTGDDFPSLESCYLTLQGRNNHYSATRIRRTVSELMPFWSAPKLQRFEIEGCELTSAHPRRPGHVAPKRAPVAYLGFRDVFTLTANTLEALFAVRTTRYWSLRSGYIGDRHFDMLPSLLASDLTGLDYSSHGKYGPYGEIGRWPDFHLLDRLRSMRIEIFHLFPRKAGHVIEFYSYALHPVPESLEQIQVDVRTYWLDREEVHHGLQELIAAVGARIVELQIRLIHRSDLRCLSSCAVEDPVNDTNREDWKFTVPEMYALQQACQETNVELVTESVWYKDLDDATMHSDQFGCIHT